MIKNIIFDMDGVIIDSESIYDIYEFDLLKKLTKNKWTLDNQISTQGSSIRDVYKILVKDFNLNLTKKEFLKKYIKVLDIVYRECKLIPGVKKLLDNLYFKKYIIALASSTSHKYINKVLDRFKLQKYFKIIVSADDTNGKSKPAPDIFLLSAKKLAVNPKSCLVIEDSNNGVTAAKRAGMFCIHFNKLKKIEPPYPDIQITTFKKLSILKIIKNIT